jgi:hypothetical protein
MATSKRRMRRGYTTGGVSRRQIVLICVVAGIAIVLVALALIFA